MKLDIDLGHNTERIHPLTGRKSISILLGAEEYEIAFEAFDEEDGSVLISKKIRTLKRQHHDAAFLF